MLYQMRLRLAFECMVTDIENGAHWFYAEERFAVLDTRLQIEL